MFGPDVANWINDNKYMLMLGALGIGGGAMMGGGQGALLGGLATPLAYMLMKDQGLFDALDAYMGVKKPGPEAPGSAGAAGAGGDATGVRDEMAENQQQGGPAAQGIPGDADGDGQISPQEAAAIAKNPSDIAALANHKDSLRLAREAALTNPEFATKMRLAAGQPAERIAYFLGVDKGTAEKVRQIAIQLQQPQ